MAGFLRKFATRKTPTVLEQNIPPVPPDPVSDAPPSLPPLFARFATSTLEEPDPISLFSSYISSPTPIQDPVPHDILRDSDTCNVPVHTSPQPPPTDIQPKKISSKPPLPAARRKYTGPGLPARQIALAPNSTCSDATDTYNSPVSPSASPSSFTPRTIHAVSTRQDRNQQHSISATLPTATIICDSDVVSSSHLLSPAQHNRPLSSQHDLITKSYSPVTNTRGSSPPASYSLDNQVPSYTPLNTPYSTLASRDPPSLLGLQNVGPLEKPASASSHTSSTTQSSSNHSNVTHITAFTSTSSIAPAIKQIDVTHMETQGRSSSGLRLARTNPFSLRSSANLNTANANAIGTSSTVERSHLSPIHRRPQTAPSPIATELPPSRHLTHSTTTITTRTTRPPAAPSTYATRTMPPRQNPHPLAVRPLTHTDVTPYRATPLEPTHARAVSVEVSTPPVRKGPLIFATMATITPPGDSVVLNMDSKAPVTVSASTTQAPVRRAVDHDGTPARGYPSPPAEYASLDQASTRRVPSLKSSSAHGHDRLSSDVGRMSSIPERVPILSVREHGRLSSEAGPVPSAAPTRKLSRGGTTMTATATDRAPEAQNSRPRTLTKSPRSRSRPLTPSSSPPKLHAQNLSSEPLFSEDTYFFDADPFAKAEGVQVMKAHAVSSSVKDKDGGVANEPAPAVPSTPPTQPKVPLTPESPDDYKSARTLRRGLWLEKARPPISADANVQQEVMSKEAELLQHEEEERLRKEEEKRQKEEEERRVKEEQQRLEEEERQLEEQRLKEEEEERLRREASIYPIMKHLSDASLLPHLLTYLTFSDWCSLYGAAKQIRGLFESRLLREYVLEHFLCTIGYSRWKFEWAEPLALSLKDLNDYMRGVSMPTYQYAQLAEAYLKPRAVSPCHPTPQVPNILSLAMTTRAYTRVVLRLRAQAESEARAVARAHVGPVVSISRSSSRAGKRDKQAIVSHVSSRAPSPVSSYSNSHGRPSVSGSSSVFRSPLVKLHRAPLLRVFVPSPEGEWLSDSSVVESEAELRRAGVLKLLRVGDVVWDVAVGDEGNLGRMVWDGSYLVDLDYKYSRMGELSPYFHSLGFAPSYFHRVIRTGVHATLNPEGNPMVYIDVSPWGKELASNLQLLQDRAMTTTPNGTLHSVMRWVHRSSFTIRPPVSPHHPHAYSHLQNLRLPIPNVDGFFIDPGWYGSVVVEVEGTNEGLSDFQDRCGPGAFPPRADNIASKMRSDKEKDNRRAFRVLREKSRPGEIWIRAVRDKERVM